MGPSLIFDKSFLQSLSVDEAAILDQLYQCVITPIFFTETLADLGKEEAKGRSPEQTVGGLAERTPVAHSAVNATHWAMIRQSLQGLPLPLDGRPAVPGGVPVKVEGQDGVVFNPSSEAQAFARWQDGRFDEVEREYARYWRAGLEAVDLRSIAVAFKKALERRGLPKTLEEALIAARQLIHQPGENYRRLLAIADLFNIADADRGTIVQRWKAAGSPTLSMYAPFAVHCAEVMLFFNIAMSASLISDQRPSNLMDVAYIFYLPFAQVFVSGDKLHRRIVPLFLRERQAFVWGPDLKAALADADRHYFERPEAEKAKGLFLLADRPPPSGLIADHWDQLRPRWREPKALSPSQLPDELRTKLFGRSNAMIEAARGRPAGIASANPDHMIIQRQIPRQRGKWRMFSAEVEAAEDRTGRG